jgi:hypothetical protein
MGSVVQSVAGFLGARRQSQATEKAAETGAEAQRYAADIQKQMFDRQMELQEPWRQAGVNALAQLAPLASQYTPFGMQQFQQDPGYAFRMSEGMKELERSAAKRGGLLSGATLKGIQRYGQDLASQEYQNAFNRYQAERQARLGPLQSLAGVGQTSAQSLGGAAGQYGSNVGNLAMTGGANTANAMLAQSNIRASQYGKIGQGLQDVYEGNYLNKLFAPKTGGYENGEYVPDLLNKQYDQGWGYGD